MYISGKIYREKYITGYFLSEALILASINPNYVHNMYSYFSNKQVSLPT